MRLIHYVSNRCIQLRPGDGVTADPSEVRCIFCAAHPDVVRRTRQALELMDMENEKLHAAKELRELAERAIAMAAKLENEAKQESPPEPPVSRGHEFRIAVQFKPGGKIYTYLVLRVRKSLQAKYEYFTTGTGDTGYFPNWEEFVAWLEGDKVNLHGGLVSIGDLVPYKAYKFGKQYR